MVDTFQSGMGAAGEMEWTDVRCALGKVESIQAVRASAVSPRTRMPKIKFTRLKRDIS